jgi:hypothetical protein
MRFLLPIVLLAACGGPPESVRVAAPTPPWCGSRGLVADVVGACAPSCLPDEEIYFVCTERAGRIAHTRHGLTTPIRWGYSVEVHDTHCLRLPSAVWELTPIEVPSATETGITTNSTRYSDCQADDYGPPHFDFTEWHYRAVPAAPGP